MKDVGVNSTLEQIYLNLPLIAEEGGEAESVDIRKKLFDDNDENAQLAISIQLIERLFVAAGLLDTRQLADHGLWRFPSFPASLMARSLLSTLVDSEQTIFPRGFWDAHNAYSDASEAQRKVLKAVENQRSKCHPDQAKPIRYIHVAWGLIIVDGKVLLRHREDASRENIGNYVLVGGRLSQQDLNEAGEPNALNVLQSPAASDNMPALETALTREIQEETGLDSSEEGNGYTYSHWLSANTFTKVEGSGANHALTEYRIHLFTITLSQHALFKLYENINDERRQLCWVSLDELGAGKSHDGKEIFLEALFAHFGGKEAWSTAIKHAPTSYDFQYRFKDKSQSVSVPFETSLFEVGATGREKLVDLPVSDEDVSMLAALKLIADAKVPTELPDGVQILGAGWIRVTDEILKNKLSALAASLAANDLPLLETRYEQYFRLDILPKYCFLSDGYANWSLNGRTYTLEQPALPAPFGVFERETHTVGLSVKLAAELSEFALGNAKRTYECKEFLKVMRRDVRDRIGRCSVRVLARDVAGNAVIKIPYKG